jgi:ubiquinone/menaquinone biosynthesis C-methylase UbiE
MERNTLQEYCKLYWYVPSDILIRSVEANLWRKCKFKKPILEIGSGDGKISELLFKGCKIDVGLDNNQESINRAKKNQLYKKVVVADAKKLPFKANTFNTVVSNSTFEHIKQNEKVIDEASRVLKKGGKLCFTVPLVKFSEVIKSKFGDDSLRKLNKRLEHQDYKSVKTWENILTKRSFKIVKKTTYIDLKTLILWYRLLKMSTFKIYKRELWSYLSQSNITKYIPNKIISKMLYKLIYPRYNKAVDENGCFVFIAAEKI